MSVAHGEQVRVLEEHGEEEGRGINWWGMIFFITSEALIFANIIASYLYLEIRQGSWRLPNGDQLLGPDLYTLILILNTIILFSSSIPARLFGRALVRGNQRAMARYLLLTAILGAIFVGLQFGVEYTHLIFDLNFVLFLLICFFRAIRGDFAGQRRFAVEAVEMYWHFVDGVWVVVFSTVYLLPLIRG